MQHQYNAVEDFVRDAYFQQWVIAPTSHADAFWQSWLDENPEKRATVEEAKKIITLLQFDADYQTNERFLQVWRQLDAAWAQQPQTSHRSKTVRLHSWQKMAAMLTGCILVGLAYFVIDRRLSTTTYTTAFGETRTVILPDSSSVTLNANSTLTFSSRWALDAAREVELQGEAFFKVRKNPNQTKFFVHTSQVRIEVLGTQFNVQERRGKTQVTLNSGKIKLSTPAVNAASQVMMEPGELAEFVENNKQLTVRQVNPQEYTAWQNRTFIFKSTPIREIIYVLEDTYGLEMHVADTSLLNKQYTGTFYRADDTIILEALATLFALRVERKQNIVRLTSY